ncbi:hypothetical protein HZU77_003060 [Neisseriaceae bacterium TC5R-5]|nr:hypothetical protein [Neisseriaceae bacterium TC5R-5]
MSNTDNTPMSDTMTVMPGSAHNYAYSHYVPMLDPLAYLNPAALIAATTPLETISENSDEATQQGGQETR